MQKKHGLWTTTVISLVIITLILPTLLLTLPVRADIEDNGSFDTAESIAVPAIVEGTIGPLDEDDIYMIEVERGYQVYAKVYPNETLGVNFYMYLEDESSKRTEVAADRAPTVGESEGVPRYVNFTCNSAQEEYIMYVWVGVYKGHGQYTLDISIAEQDDGDSDTDAGDTYEGATPLAAGEYSGFVANADDEDIYRIALVKGDSLYVDLLPEPFLSTNLYLMRQVEVDGLPEYEEVRKDKMAGDEGKGAPRHVEYTLDSSEENVTMFLRIYRDQHRGNYTLKVNIHHQNDGGSGTDAPDGKESPLELAEEGTYMGFMKGLDVADHYSLELTDRERMTVNLTPDGTAALSMFLFIDGSEVDSDEPRHPDHEKGEKRSVNYTVPRIPDVLQAILSVELEAGHGNYSLSVTIEPKPADNQPPAVNLTEPGPDPEVKKRNIVVRGTATDYNEVTRIEVSSDQETWQTADLTGDMGEYQWNTSIRLESRGNNTLYVRAVDDQGNEKVYEYSIRYDVERESPGFEVVALLLALVVVLVFAGRRRD